jgi:hypothetical protein
MAVIGAVGTLAVGIGFAAGSFLLAQRTAVVGAGADYVPADAPFFMELRLEPSDGQDAALRELLGHFPAIEDVDLGRPLYAQLTEQLDEMLLAGGSTVSWAGDVAPWFDGHVAMALTALPETPADPMANPPVPPFVVLLGVTDQAAAEAALGRLLTEAGDPGLSDEEHAGVTIRSSTTGEGAYALTADQLVLGSSADDVRAALDTHAAGTGTLAELADMTRLIEQLPDDWLAFVSYDMTDLMAQAFTEAGTAEPDVAAALETLVEHQSLRGAMAMSAAGDRFILDAATDAATGPFAPVNEDRGLADEVPSDTLYFSDAGNVGAALAGVIGPLKEAAAATPETAEQLRVAEAALGGDFEELVSWIDDAAIVVGYDGGEPYGGLVLVPNDVDAAQRRMDQLGSFAALAALDPSSGISVDERAVAGVTITTIRWAAPDEATAFMVPIAGGVSLEYAVTDDRALIGVGEAFVGRVLELDASASLASQARYTDAVASLGGAENAGVTWLDLAGTLAAFETALGPTLGSAEGGGVFEAEVRPWLAPLDRMVSVSRLEGDVLVQRAALLVD